MEPLGERALRFAIEPHVDRRALLDALRSLDGVIDAVITETHAAVSFEREPPVIDDALLARSSVATAPREHLIRVAYDGPDLQAVADALSLDTASLIARHTAATYEVSFVGFLPGFAYLRGLDPELASLPRRASPRPRVPAGSVALAGGFTGIYPFATPGGWMLLGRAIDHRPLDPRGEPLLALGDRVRFEQA